MSLQERPFFANWDLEDPAEYLSDVLVSDIIIKNGYVD